MVTSLCMHHTKSLFLLLYVALCQRHPSLTQANASTWWSSLSMTAILTQWLPLPLWNKPLHKKIWQSWCSMQPIPMGPKQLFSNAAILPLLGNDGHLPVLLCALLSAIWQSVLHVPARLARPSLPHIGRLAQNSEQHVYLLQPCTIQQPPTCINLTLCVGCQQGREAAAGQAV